VNVTGSTWKNILNIYFTKREQQLMFYFARSYFLPMVYKTVVLNSVFTTQKEFLHLCSFTMFVCKSFLKKTYFKKAN